MDFSSLSGLFVVAGIGVALTMFVPAWAKRSETVHEVREATRSVRQTAKIQREATKAAIRHTSVTPAQLDAKLERVAIARKVLALVFIGAVGASIYGLVTISASVVTAPFAAISAVVDCLQPFPGSPAGVAAERPQGS